MAAPGGLGRGRGGLGPHRPLPPCHWPPSTASFAQAPAAQVQQGATHAPGRNLAQGRGGAGRAGGGGMAVLADQRRRRAAAGPRHASGHPGSGGTCPWPRWGWRGQRARRGAAPRPARRTPAAAARAGAQLGGPAATPAPPCAAAAQPEEPGAARAPAAGHQAVAVGLAGFAGGGAPANGGTGGAAAAGAAGAAAQEEGVWIDAVIRFSDSCSSQFR